MEHITQLKILLSKMDIPRIRVENCEEVPNLRWLSRNLHIKNSTHRDYAQARMIIVKLLNN